MIKVLSNIVPFNDVFYLDCLFHSFFPVCTHYGKSINHVLANDLFIFGYRQDRHDMHLRMEPLPRYSLAELINIIGIDHISYMVCDDPIGTVKRAIDNDRPVITWINCRYEPIRPDTYQKLDWAHTLLIFGYDDSTNELIVVEHRHRDNLQYEPRRLKFNDFIACYEGYLSYFAHGQFPTYHEFYLGEQHFAIDKDEASADNTAKHSFISYTLDNTSVICDGLDQLTRFADGFAKSCLHGDVDLEQLQYFLNRLNKVINVRTMERYRLDVIMGLGLSVDKLTKAIDTWKEMRFICAKAVFSNKLRPTQCSSMGELLPLIVELERDAFSEIQNLLMQNG